MAQKKESKIHLFIGFLILFSTLLSAQEYSDKAEPYSLRLGYGFSDANDLGQILVGDWRRYEGDTSLLNLDGGYRLGYEVFDIPLDIYMKSALSYFNENGLQKNFLELTFYFKAYLKFDFWHNRVRLGAGEGLSLAQEIPIVEIDDADGDPTAKFLNYLDISLDFDVGRLIHVDAMNNLYLGYTLKHRSGIFGLFNGVHGGSNYNLLTLEKNF